MKMTSSKKLAVLVLTCLITLTWASAPIAAEQVRLLMMGQFADYRAGLIRDMIAEYQTAYPGTTVEYAATGNSTEFLDKLSVMKAAGQTPDVVWIKDQWIPSLVAQGIIAPIPASQMNQINRVYIPQALSLVRQGGQLYGYPVENMVSAMLYNGRMLADAGMRPTSPRSWADLESMAAKLTVTNPDGSVKQQGLGMWNQAQITAVNVGSYVWSNGSDIFAGTEPFAPVFDKTETLNAFKYFTDLYTNKRMAVYGGAEGTYLAQGKIAMFIAQGPYYRTSVLQTAGADFQPYLGVWAVNWGSTGKAVTRQYGWLFSPGADSKNPEAAHHFMSWLTMATTARGTTRMGDFEAALYSIPVTKPDLQLRMTEYAKDPYMAAFNDIFINGEVHNDARSIPMWDQLVILNQALKDSWANKKNPVQAVADAQAQAMALMPR